MAEHVVVRCEAEMVGEVLTPFEQAGLSIVGLKTTNDGRAVIAMRVEGDAHAVAAPLLASVRTRCAVWASASNEEALTHMSNAFAPNEIVQQPRTRARRDATGHEQVGGEDSDKVPGGDEQEQVGGEDGGQDGGDDGGEDSENVPGADAAELPYGAHGDLTNAFSLDALVGVAPGSALSLAFTARLRRDGYVPLRIRAERAALIRRVESDATAWFQKDEVKAFSPSLPKCRTPTFARWRRLNSKKGSKRMR